MRLELTQPYEYDSCPYFSPYSVTGLIETSQEPVNRPLIPSINSSLLVHYLEYGKCKLPPTNRRQGLCG